MGGLRKFMPVTFATYAIGMLALAGFPLFFSGFWSKDEILHAAHGWPVSHVPFILGMFGALLTAFYMSRQVALVFFGKNRAANLECGDWSPLSHAADSSAAAARQVVPHQSADKSAHSKDPHESPAVMTWPLIILAACAIGLSVIGTPAWPWFQSFLGQHHGETGFTSGVISLMVLSSVIVFAGLGVGWWLYGRKPIQKADEPDVLEKLPAGIYTWLQRKYCIDELYEITVIRFNAWWAKACAFLDEWVWGGLVLLVSYVVLGLSFVSRFFDELVINLGFDQSCDGVSLGGKLMSRLQDGRVQNYLRIIGIALAALVLLLIWGGGK